MSFSWVPIFKELGERLFSYEDRQEYLVDVLKRAGVTVGLEDRDQGRTISLTVIDPIMFFLQILKTKTTQKRLDKLSFIKNEFGLKSDLPTGFDGVPNPNPMNAWMFGFKDDRHENDLQTIWAFERAVFADEVTDNQ